MKIFFSVVAAVGIVAGAFYSGYQMGISKASTILLQPAPIAPNWSFDIADSPKDIETFLNEKGPQPQNIRIEAHADIGYYVFCSPDKSGYEYHAIPVPLNESNLRQYLTDSSRVFGGLAADRKSPIIVTLAYDKKH